LIEGEPPLSGAILITSYSVILIRKIQTQHLQEDPLITSLLSPNIFYSENGTVAIFLFAV